MNITLVTDKQSSTQDIAEALKGNGHDIVCQLAVDSNFVPAVVSSNSQLLVIDVKEVNRETLNEIRLLQNNAPLPILLFASQKSDVDPDKIFNTGVSTYVINGYRADRLPSLIDNALAKHKQLQGLRDELECAKRNIEERRVIERAKGIIMQKRGLNEDEAYSLLRKLAMNQSKKLVEIARNIIGLADVLV